MILGTSKDGANRLIVSLSQRHTWRFYTPIAANLIASDFRHRLMRTRLAIFFADRGDVAVLKTHVIKSPNLMGWLHWRFAAINVENRGSEFNRRYLTCQISAILYADRGDRRKSQSLHLAHLAIFADRGDRRIKSPSVSLALAVFGVNNSIRHFVINFQPPVSTAESAPVDPKHFIRFRVNKTEQFKRS